MNDIVVTHPSAYAEVYRFLISSPTPEQIIDFHPSEATQERVRWLLSTNEASELNAEEQAKLDEFESVNHFVSMLKIFARQQLAGNT